MTAAAPIVTPAASTPVEAAPLSFAEADRPGGFLVGDTAFPRFISPVSNPVFSKDPRAQTYIRGLFINDVIPGDHPLGGGSFQAMAAQVNVALSERLTFIADKDGYAWINPQRAPSSSGFLNLGAGLKYSLIRDVENQFILSTGFMYELPTGERSAFSGQGDGTMTFFGTFGKEWRENWHALGTFGYQLPLDSNSNSSYFYTSLHFDYRATCWFYPIAELNWFHYTAGGDRGLPPALGEGDGLINLGTSGVAGNDLVTAAFGGRFLLGDHVSTGVVWEFPLSNRQDLISNRLIIDLILRY